jgi:hypothetical protein
MEAPFTVAKTCLGLIRTTASARPPLSGTTFSRAGAIEAT